MTAVLNILAFLFTVESAAAFTDKNILVYSQNSSQTFEDLWSHTSGYNDQGLKHEAIPRASSILDAGNFRAEMNSSWGIPVYFFLEFRSARGYIIGEMVFDVSDVDVNNMSTWFNLERLVDWFPHDLNVKVFDFTLSSGDRELLVTETEANKAWFSIVHNSGNFDPAIVLARNSTSLLTTYKSVADILYEGCYPDYEVSYELQYEDATSMTVDSCFLECKDSGHDYVGMQLGDSCFCTSFIAKSNQLSHMCTLSCPGDTSQNCGGTNVGYWAMYSGTVKLSDFNNIVENNASGLLVNKTDNTYLQTNTSVFIGDELIWDDTYAYISNISVFAETATGQFTTYTFSFAGYYSEQETYADDEGSPALEFSTNGSSNKIDILPIFNLTIYFTEPVTKSTVLLYGPNETYVTVPHILLRGIFDDFTTSSSYSTSSAVPSTSVTSADTTSDSTTSEPTSADTTSDSTTSEPTSADTTSDSTTSEPTSADTTSDSTTSEPTSADTTSDSTTSKSTSADTTSDSTTTEPTSADTTSDSTTSEPTSADTTSDSTTTEPTSADTTSDSATSIHTSADTSSDSTTSGQTSADTNLEATPSADTTSVSATSEPLSSHTTSDSTTSGRTSADTTLDSTTPGPTSADINLESTSSGPTSRDIISDSTTSLATSPDSTTSRPISTTTGSNEGTASSSTASTGSASSPATTLAVSKTTLTSTTSTTTLGPYAACSANDSTMLLINGQTYCPCFNITVLMTNETVDIDALVAELTIDRKQVSAYTRKFTSAEDNRPSAQTLGTFGVIVMVVAVGGIIYLDSASLLQEFGRLRHNYKYLKRKLSKRISKVNILENIETTSSEAQCEPGSGGNVSYGDALPQVSG